MVLKLWFSSNTGGWFSLAVSNKSYFYAREIQKILSLEYEKKSSYTLELITDLKKELKKNPSLHYSILQELNICYLESLEEVADKYF